MERSRRREARERATAQKRPQLDNLLDQISNLEPENKAPDVDNQRGADALEEILNKRATQRSNERSRVRTRDGSRAELPVRQASSRQGQRTRQESTNERKDSSSESRRIAPSRTSEAETEKTLNSSRISPANSSRTAPVIPNVRVRREIRNDSGLDKDVLSDLSPRPSRTSRPARSNSDRARRVVQPTRNRSGSVTSTTTDFMSIAASLRIGSLFNDELSEAATSYTNDSNVPDLTDSLTLNSLLVQATADTEGFPILTPEKYLAKKKRLVQISNTFESIQNKLSLEFKVKEATDNVIKFNSSNPQELEEAKYQLKKSERKMQDLSKDLWAVIGDLIYAERAVLKHLGGSLRWKVIEHSVTMSDAPTLKVKPTETELKRKLNSSEERVRELEAQVNVLKNNISRLENEQVPLRELASNAQREARKAREDRDFTKRSMTSPTGQPSNLEFNKIKLDYATCKAELTDVKEELGALKDSQASLQLQLEEDQALILSKDRKIANLLSELEEASNKIEYSQAGGQVGDGQFSSLSRMMGRKSSSSEVAQTEQMQSVIASQLKEAVLEREKLKLKLEQEIEKRTELERRLQKGGQVSSARSSATEEDIKSPRIRQRRTPPNARVSNYQSDTKIAELEAEIEQLKSKQDTEKGNLMNDIDMYSLEAIHNQIEKELDLKPEEFSVSLFEQNFNQFLKQSKSLSAKLKDSMRELAFVEDEKDRLLSRIENEQKNHSTTRDAFEIQYQNLEAECNQLRRKVGEFEMGASRIPELQSIIDDQAKQLKKYNIEKENDYLEHQAELNQFKATMKEEMSKLKQGHQMELDELKQKRDDTLDMLDSQLDKEKRSFESRLLKEVELAKLSAAEEYTIQFEQKMRLAQENHKSEIQEILAAHELEKSKIKSSFQQEQIEAQTRLEMAEQALVDSKQQFFMEREKYQEKIDALQRDIDDFKSRSKSTSEEWNSKRAEFQVIIDRLNDDLDSMQSKISETNKKLELKSREVLEIQGLHEIELKSLKQEYQAQISALENQIKETDALVKGAQSKNGQTAEQLQEAKQEIEKLKADIEAQKLKTAKDVQKSQDALDDATDQLSRVQRVLKEVNSDVERYRKLADERDNEVLTLKRTLRQKEKELTEGAMSNTSDSSQLRKILDQKDNEIDSFKADVRSLQAEVAALQRKLEVKDREIEDAKNDMRRVNGADKDEQSEELARLQLMLFELKTTRADLLEQLDDAQHETEMLRQQLKKQSD